MILIKDKDVRVVASVLDPIKNQVSILFIEWNQRLNIIIVQHFIVCDCVVDLTTGGGAMNMILTVFVMKGDDTRVVW